MLREFMRDATPDERQQVADAAGIELSYLQKLASGGKCSVSVAYWIESEIAALVRKNRVLPAVSGETLVNNAAKYRDFVARVKANQAKKKAQEARL